MSIFKSIANKVKQSFKPREINMGGENIKFKSPSSVALSSVGGFSKISKAPAAIKGAGNFIKGAYNFLKTASNQKLLNSGAGAGSFAAGAKQMGKAAAATAGTGALSTLIYYGAKSIRAESPPNIKKVASDTLKNTATGAMLGASFLPGLVGTGSGEIQKGNKIVSNFWDALKNKGMSRIDDAKTEFNNTYKNIKDDLPTSPAVNIYNQLPSSFTPQDVMPQLPQTVYIESPQTPQMSIPSFSPSFSVGGGGGLSESLPLLLLLGAGIGGYALGRRKKKRYKKRKRHKK